jgi:threonine dehydratase
VTVEQAVTIADVQAAAERIGQFVIRTQATHSKTLSAITGADVFVKFENLQFTASYKERGALNRLLLLPAGTTGVVAASAGNFAQGVAYHATRLGLPAVIVMPESTPNIKVSRTEVLGAEVVRAGDTFEAASAAATHLAAERGYELLSPFDDVAVIAGQGTVALEFLDDVPDLDVLIAPVGGGGLMAGIAVAARHLRSDIELVGVQTERFPAVYNTLEGTNLPVGGSTIAEGIAVAAPGTVTVALIRELADRVDVVSESLIEEAISLLLEVEKSVAEGAGAIALAELLARPNRYAGRRVGIVISGGNIDIRQLASVIMRSLVKSGRLSTFWIEVEDRPGHLGRVTTDVGLLGGNIIDVVHRRLDPTVHARASDVQFTVETADRLHLTRLLTSLVELGYRVNIADESHRPFVP